MSSKIVSFALLMTLASFARGNVVLVGSNDEVSGGQTITAIDSKGRVREIEKSVVVPEVLNLKDSRAFGILSSSVDSTVAAHLSIYDAETMRFQRTLTLGTRLLPISPWPPTRISSSSHQSTMLTILEIGDDGIFVAIRSLEDGRFLKKIVLPSEFTSISMPFVFWTGDDKGIVVVNSTTGIGKIFDAVSGNETDSFTLFREAKGIAVRFQIVGESNGRLVALTGSGALVILDCQSNRIDASKYQYVSLWEGARSVGEAMISLNGRFLAIPQLSVGQDLKKGTKNLLLVDLEDRFKQRFLVSSQPLNMAITDVLGNVVFASSEGGIVMIMNAHNGALQATAKLPAATFLLAFLAQQNDNNAASTDTKSRMAFLSNRFVIWISGIVVALIIGSTLIVKLRRGKIE